MTKSRVFQLIDFDRTLFDTSAFAKAVTAEVDSVHPGMGSMLTAEFEAAYKREETFFLFRYLRTELGDSVLTKLVEKVIEKYGADTFKLTGFEERLRLANALEEQGIGWGILSYGEAIDQFMKFRIVGLENARILLTETPDKAEIIRSWLQVDGTFHLPPEYGGGVVDELTFEDDKLRAFTNLPAHVLGVWMSPNARLDTEQRKDFPSLHLAHSLNESIEIISKKFLQ